MVPRLQRPTWHYKGHRGAILADLLHHLQQNTGLQRGVGKPIQTVPRLQQGIDATGARAAMQAEQRGSCVFVSAAKRSTAWGPQRVSRAQHCLAQHCPLVNAHYVVY
jgi:hypothetical protein